MSGYQDDVFFRIAILEHPGNRAAMQAMYGSVQEMVANMTGIVTKIGDTAKTQLNDISSSLQRANQQLHQGTAGVTVGAGVGGSASSVGSHSAAFDSMSRSLEQLNRQYEATNKLLQATVDLSNRRAAGYEREAESLQQVINASNSGIVNRPGKSPTQFTPGVDPFATHNTANDLIHKSVAVEKHQLLKDEIELTQVLTKQEKAEQDQFNNAAEEKKRKLEELQRLRDEDANYDWGFTAGGTRIGGSKPTGDSPAGSSDSTSTGVVDGNLVESTLKQAELVAKLQGEYDRLAKRASDSNRLIVESGSHVLNSVGKIAEGIVFLGLSNKKQSQQWVQEWAHWYAEVKGGFNVIEGAVKGVSDIWLMVNRFSDALRNRDAQTQKGNQLQREAAVLTEQYTQLLHQQAAAENRAADAADDHARSRSGVNGELAEGVAGGPTRGRGGRGGGRRGRGGWRGFLGGIGGAVAGDLAGDAIYGATGSSALAGVGDEGIDALLARGGVGIGAGGIGAKIAGGISSVAALPGAGIAAAGAALGSVALVAVELTEALRGTANAADSVTQTLGKYSGANRAGEMFTQYFGTTMGAIDNTLGLDTPMSGLYRSSQDLRKMQRGRIKYETMGFQNELNEANALAGSDAAFQRAALRRDARFQMIDYDAEYMSNRVDASTESSRIGIGNRISGQRRNVLAAETVYGSNSEQAKSQERMMQELQLQQRQVDNYGQMEKSLVNMRANEAQRSGLASHMQMLLNKEAELRKRGVDATAEIEQNLQQQADIAQRLEQTDNRRYQLYKDQKDILKSIANEQRQFAEDRLRQLQNEEASMTSKYNDRLEAFSSATPEERARFLRAKQKLDSGSDDPVRRAQLEREVQAAAMETESLRMQYEGDEALANAPQGKGGHRISHAKRVERQQAAFKSRKQFEEAEGRLNILREELGNTQPLTKDDESLVGRLGSPEDQQKIKQNKLRDPANAQYNAIYFSEQAQKLEANRTEQRQLALQLQNQVTVKLDEQFNEEFFRNIVQQNILPEMERRMQAGFTQISRNLNNQQAANKQQADAKLQQARNQAPQTK